MPEPETGLVEEAAEIARLLREATRRYQDLPVETEIRRSGLTMPQVSAITRLYDRGPLSLKDLSSELGLSHSTVSGIVDRLERRGLLQRETDARDRRLTRISITPEVQGYVDSGLLQAQLGRLLPALRSATRQQRRQIREGLALLLSLIEAPTALRRRKGPARS